MQRKTVFPLKKEVRYLTRKWVLTCLRENRKSIAQQEILRFADAIGLGEVNDDQGVPFFYWC